MKGNFWLTCFCLVLVTVSFSQTEKLPLADYIKTLQSEFNVKFSYAVEDVANIIITKPDTVLNLDDTLDYLNANTLLNFKTIDQRYITVSVLEKTISICGTVYSATANQSLLGASVIIKGTTKGTTTNYNGQFQFSDLPLNATLSISYLGYESQDVLAKYFFSDSEPCKPVRLIENNEMLNEVLITKYLTTGLQKLMDGSLLLNTDQFGILPGLIAPDILQSIQALPGIESVNESIANINVRGGTNDQNLMLWDGIKMYHSGHFFGLISAYNPNLTNKVVVTKNGTSSQYSDGVSSTINMFTKDELSHTISGGAGINLISADAFLELPITKKLELHLSGRRSITDVFTTPTYDNYFERSFQDSDINTNASITNSNTQSDFVFYDYSAKVLFDLNKNHKFRANVIGINNTLDYAESITDSENTTTLKTSNLSQNNLGYGGNWQAQWTDKFSTIVAGSYSLYNVDASDLRVQTDQRLTQANEVLETGVQLKTQWAITSNLSFLNGYQFDEIGILNETTVTAPSYDRTKKDVLLNHALFSEVEYNKNNTYFRIGVRANYFQKFNQLLIEPRLNIRQKLNNQFALKLEGEFKNQSATQIVDFQDDFLGVENRRWILADNEAIPISKSKQASFGVDFKQHNFSIDVTSFYKVVNGITARNQGFYNNFQYLNATGNYTAKGLEFLANKTADNFSTWLSYTYSINDYEFESFTPSVFPNNVDIRHSVSLAFNYTVLDNLQLSLGGTWRSGQPYTKPLEDNQTIKINNNYYVNYDQPNSHNVAPFFRIDTSVSYDINLSEQTKLTLRAGVRNLTNQNNIINRYFEVDPEDTNQTIEINNKSLGLTPNVSLRVSF
ncbi:carboxypeptidase-like regulatory domain-containing protein [Olleya sp. HaHaR_3_96]|uniref:TonB-dependent receptor n=1 Tax=Olleya sp. HaHaR_3_96 TaxID=2745560 RepID=UPI001C4E5F69|nr:carboxypeptidase-like regulatory domain-containing protein [Olleya sp. HaHaR_3_96]QXP60041.1 carboxypeptidase-like regulatory domain-containing protein [Olleya sp. HaHaR_3_96]